MLTNGFVSISREINEWELYGDYRALAVFCRLATTSNFTTGNVRGVNVEAGERVICIEEFAKEMGMPKSTLLDVLKRLEKHGIADRKPTANFTIIKLKKYLVISQPDRSPTETRPQPDRNPTRYNKDNKDNKDNKEKNEGGASAPASPSPSPAITFDSLISEFGKANVDAYTIKVRNWMRRKGIKGEPTAELVGKWLNEDRGKLKRPGDDKSNIAVSFDVDELEKSSYARYQKKSSIDMELVKEKSYARYRKDKK